MYVWMKDICPTNERTNGRQNESMDQSLLKRFLDKIVVSCVAIDQQRRKIIEKLEAFRAIDRRYFNRKKSLFRTKQ